MNYNICCENFVLTKSATADCCEATNNISRFAQPLKSMILRTACGSYTIRKIHKDEYYVLDDFIYEAIFIPEGVEPPPKSIIAQPDLQVYIKDFGTEKDDICFVAEVGGRIVGAVWVRDMQDYGHIADGVPSFVQSHFIRSTVVSESAQN